MRNTSEAGLWLFLSDGIRKIQTKGAGGLNIAIDNTSPQTVYGTLEFVSGLAPSQPITPRRTFVELAGCLVDND